MRDLDSHELANIAGGGPLYVEIGFVPEPVPYVVYEPITVYEPVEIIEVIEEGPLPYYVAAMPPVYGAYMCDPFVCNVHLGPAYW